MNATETIFALALASNHNPQHHFLYAFKELSEIGILKRSKNYLIPCRDGVGAQYWNAACLLTSKLSVDDLSCRLKQMELETGRIRPSHQISLDIDLIAWGTNLKHMQFNPKKWPLALDVKVPMFDLWKHSAFEHQAHVFPTVHCMPLED